MAGSWDGQSVYLTGGTGFIGSEIARRLVKQGAEVTCLTRDASRAEHLSKIGCTIDEGNVLEPGSLSLPADVDTVIHGAAWVAYGVPRQKHDLFRRTNVDGTKHVLEAAKQAGARRFCHISSVAAIGPTPAGLYTEERVANGRVPMYRSLYEETKHQAHLHVAENAGGLEVVLPMPGVVLGREGEFAGLLEAFHQGDLWGLTGDNPSPYVHVQDTVDGIVAAAERGQGAYILVDQNLTFQQLLHVFGEASDRAPPERSVPTWVAKAAASLLQVPYHLRGKVPPLSKELVEQLELPYTYSSLKAVDELGWQPDLVGHLEADFRALSS